jgi:D-proline reductase (dithiol) PrdB
MVRLADLSDTERKGMLGRIKELSAFDGKGAWINPPPLAACRVAIVTTAGIHRKGDIPFTEGPAQADYRILPGDTPAADITMSHNSINYDRTGFQQDINVVFPIDRLRELAADKVIGSVADFHYSFMGALPAKALEPRGRALAGLLKQDKVDAVILTPV